MEYQAENEKWNVLPQLNGVRRTQEKKKDESLTHDQLVAKIQRFFDHLNAELLDLAFMKKGEESEMAWLNAQKVAYEEVIGAFHRVFGQIISEDIL